MEHIRQERAGAVGVITIDRPGRFNSLDVQTARDLRKASLEFARDDGLRAIVLRGVNGVFCSGADLKYIYAGATPEDLSYLQPEANATREGFGEIFKQILEYLHSTISEINRAAKPFIAAVDGIAAAGGFGLAMCCDLVFASERSSFEWAYKRTGLSGAESSTFFLPRLLGLRRAMAMVLLNPRLSASEALDWGLINAVYPTEQFEAETMAIAQRLAQGPTQAYGLAKGLIHQAAGVDRLDHHLDRELETLARIADGGDFQAGIEAFFAKKAPDFHGR